jgi:predicted RNase H-like nuclease (RuvC/YqgF family)
MALFGKKFEKFEPDPPKPEPRPEPRSKPKPKPKPKPKMEAKLPEEAVEEARSKTTPEPRQPTGAVVLDYGIEQTIALMRTLPMDKNVDLVMAAVRGTLESMNVRVSDIIEDAKHKQERIRERVAELEHEITDFKAEMKARRDEISGLESDLRETTEACKHLEGALKAEPGNGKVRTHDKVKGKSKRFSGPKPTKN